MPIRNRLNLLQKRDNPVQYASGYTLDLYCKYANSRHDTRQVRNTFVGEDFKDCHKQAILTGWILDTATRTATCPICTGTLQKRRTKN